MLLHALLVAHIAVLGYWLGAELVINSTFRYVSAAASLPFAERDRLLDHVLDVDQHVRYALILQAGLGTALAALLGYFPGGYTVASATAIGAVAWLVLVEVTHRLRKAPVGSTLASVDNLVRYAAILALVAGGGGALLGAWPLPGWLAVKLALFAAVILCGLGIRLAIIRYYRTWRDIEQAGSTATNERKLWGHYRAATTVLILLWVCIAGIVFLSVFRP